MRFLFRPPAAEATGLLALPWDRAAGGVGPGACCWRCRSAASRGTSSGSSPPTATSTRSRRSTSGWPATSTRCSPSSRRRGCRPSRCSASASTGPHDQPAILVTRYLEYSMSYRYLFSSPRGDHSAEQLIDTLVELLVRLHLAGIFWGDCSLSNTLFRPDAGATAAYLVDAETVERHPTLSPGQRGYDVDLATRAGRRRADGPRVRRAAARGHRPDRRWPTSLPAAVRGAVGRGDPRGGLRRRGAALPDRRAPPAAQRPRASTSSEVELITSAEGGVKLRVQTRVAEPGQHRRELFRLTGLEVQEKQARRLLNDLRGFRAWLEQRDGAVGARDVRGAPLGQRDLPADRRRDPAGPRRPAGAGRGLPRDPRAPVVPVRAGQARRRDDGGGARPTSRTCCRRRPRRSPRRR